MALKVLLSGDDATDTALDAIVADLRDRFGLTVQPILTP